MSGGFARYLARRLGQMLITLWVIATILFLMFRLMPGNPLAAYIDPTFTQEQAEVLLHQFGLDQPLYVQYGKFLLNLLHGDLGQSFFYHRPVSQVLLDSLPNTIYLMLASLLIAYVIGISGGIGLAMLRGRRGEQVGIVATLVSRSAPQFWVGMILLALFSFHFGWFPGGGIAQAGTIFPSEWAKLGSGDFWLHLALPAFTLTFYLLGLPLLLMRTNMLEVLGEDFITMMRMKGFGEWRIMVRHAARNALLPVVTAMAVGIGYAIGGNVVVETVFSWPGLGRLLVASVQANDYPVAQGAFLVSAALMVLMNLIADLLYGVLDPRVKTIGGDA